MSLDDLFGSNLRQFLRRSNIFGSGDDTQYGTPPFVPESSSILPALRGTNSDKRYGSDENLFRQTSSVVDSRDSFDPTSRMKELYQPETGMSNRYTKALDEMPVRNKPGLLRKIIGGVSAFGTHPAANVEEVLYGPYHEKLKDWQTKIAPLEHAANIERQNNANLRMVANQILSQEMSDRRLQRQYSRDQTLGDLGWARYGLGEERVKQGEERVRQGDERLSQGDQRIRQADERMKIAREVSKGGQFKVDDAGNAFIARRDGTTIPVNGNYLSFEEKEGLRADTAGAAARAKEGAKKNRVVERVIEDPSNPGKTIRVSIDLDTGDATPIKVRGGAPAAATPPKSELEQGRGIANKAQQVKAGNAKWSSWIKIKNNKVDITPPGYIFGPSKEEYDQIYQSIYGSAPPAESPTTKGTPTAVAKKAAKPGMMRVVGPNGESGQMPIGSALLPGWRKE